MSGQDISKTQPSSQPAFRPGLMLAVGSRRFSILDLRPDSCLIRARDSALLRGAADLYDGTRHLAQCLLLRATAEGDLLRCVFQRRSTFAEDPLAVSGAD